MNLSKISSENSRNLKQAAKPTPSELERLLKLWDFNGKTQHIGFLRVSLHYTHDFADIDYFFAALEKSITKILHKKA